MPIFVNYNATYIKMRRMKKKSTKPNETISSSHANAAFPDGLGRALKSNINHNYGFLT